MSRAHTLFIAVLAAFVATTPLVAAAPDARAADAAKDSKPAAAAKLKKNQVWLAPDWDTRAIRSIAIAPLRSVERNAEAEALSRRGLEAALAGRPYRFRSASTFLEAIKIGKAEAAWITAQAAAARSAPLDSATVRALHDALSADAVLVASVTNWQRYVVDEQTRGASFTQVGVEVALYSLADGVPLWRGNFVEKGDGPYNEPQGGDATSRDPSGYNAGRKAALEPPAYEEVIEKLMSRVAAALPKPVSAAAPARS
jgi:hypothetical protein